ncbi:MAG: enolase C-terminal domain-like protein [Bacteroidales bacterium]
MDVLKVSGPYTYAPGFNMQYQAQPMHIYPEATPQPYQDLPDPKEVSVTLTHHYLRIRTRGGIEGLYGYIDPETISPILQQLTPLLLGEDAMAVEKIWDKLYRSNRHSRAGHYMMALSAVDNALWDVRGRYFGVPVYQLLGGPTRKEVPIYGSCLGYSAEPGKAGPRAKQLFDQGFANQKWFLPYGPGSGNKGLELNINLVKELREALGWEAQLMFDAFMGWDLPYALAWTKAVEAFRPYFIEEAFPPNRLENYVRLSQSTTIPVATGEHFYNRWEVQEFLDAGAIQIVQADPEWCGGVSELIKICHLASSHGLQVIPHGHNVHAALHVVASQSPETCPMSESLLLHVPGKLHFQKDPLLSDTGLIPLRETPGFGIELDTSKIERQEIL